MKNQNGKWKVISVVNNNYISFVIEENSRGDYVFRNEDFNLTSFNLYGIIKKVIRRIIKYENQKKNYLENKSNPKSCTIEEGI
jgi:translation elongation factor EF-Ts